MAGMMMMAAAVVIFAAMVKACGKRLFCAVVTFGEVSDDDGDVNDGGTDDIHNGNNMYSW